MILGGGGSPLPDFDFLIFRAASDCILKKSYVVAPGHVSYPIIMRKYFLCNDKLIVSEVPELYLAVDSPTYEALRWKRELHLLRRIHLRC